jgi:peptide/nickel transport system permease protein
MTELRLKATVAGERATEATDASKTIRSRRRHPLIQHTALVVAASILCLVVVICMAAPLWPIADPLQVNILDRYAAPGTKGYPLGADQLGRDVLSRLIWGGRISIAIGIAANLIVTILGVTLGLSAGYFGGKVDNVIMRLTDVFLAFPGLLLALTLLAFLGVSLINAVIAIIISSVPGNVRFVRGQVMQARQLPFVEAARCIGCTHSHTMFRQILPYITPFILTLTALHATSFFLATAGLSVIGLGVEPPNPDWGSMIGQSINAIYEAPHALLAPTILLTVIAICFNIIGDEVQSILDPKGMA